MPRRQYIALESQREFDRMSRGIRKVERMEPRPKRTRRRKGGGAAVSSEPFRAIRGLTYTSVTASATSFEIDTVVPLASGRDPVSGDLSARVLISKPTKESFPVDYPITAVYNGTGWELLPVERFHSGRGQSTGTQSGATVTVDNLIMHASGLDPRGNPASSTETLVLQNVHSQSYVDNELIEFDYRADNNTWEARKKAAASTPGSIRIGRVYATITAATGNLAANWGSGQVKFFNDTTGVEDVNPTTVSNNDPTTYDTDTVVKCSTQFSPPRVLVGSCETL